MTFASGNIRSRNRYQADLERRYEGARRQVRQLTDMVEDQRLFAWRGDVTANARLAKLERELKEAEIDAGRLEALLAEELTSA